MKTQLAMTLLAMVGATGCIQESQSDQSPEGWVVANRSIPLPFDASSELIQALSEIPAPDVEATNQNFPRNDEEWISSVTDVDQFIG